MDLVIGVRQRLHGAVDLDRLDHSLADSRGRVQLDSTIVDMKSRARLSPGGLKSVAQSIVADGAILVTSVNLPKTEGS